MSATYPRLSAHSVRITRFRHVGWGRGVDERQMYAFLARVADELDLWDRDLAAARAEAERAKTALREWQTRNARATDRRWPGGPR